MQKKEKSVGFDISKVNEVVVKARNVKNLVSEAQNFVAEAKIQAEGFRNDVKSMKKQVNSLVSGISNGNAMEVLTSTAMQNKRWFGHSSAEYKQIQADIYDLGQILTANFYVFFESYKNNNLASVPMVNNSKTYCYLATETNIPLINANFDTIQAGAVQINHFTGIVLQELQINMLETGEGIISNSLLTWLSLMINEDGSVNPPASYAGRVTVGVFSKDFGLDVKPIQRSFLVAPSASMIDSLNSMGVSEVLQIPMTLTVLRGFME